MKNFYQDIFNKQKVKDGDQGIEDFLKSDGDSDPYEELVKRQLTNETRDPLEGKISLNEMTKALNEDMNVPNDNIGSVLINLLSTMQIYN